MANTYIAIATVTVGSGGAANITFSSIPQTYNDLKLIFSLREAASNGVVKVTFNGSTTGYSAKQLVGAGGSGVSSNNNYTGGGTFWGAEGTSVISGFTDSTFSNCEIYIPNYTSSNNKSISADSVIENNASVSYVSLSAGLWSNSAAITSITIVQYTGNNFVQYSTATLYGIKNS